MGYKSRIQNGLVGSSAYLGFLEDKMVNHTNYDPDLWSWCPDPVKYTQLKNEGLVLFEGIKKEMKSIVGGGEIHEADVVLALAIFNRQQPEHGIGR